MVVVLSPRNTSDNCQVHYSSPSCHPSIPGLLPIKYTMVINPTTQRYITLLPIKYTMVILSPSNTTHYCPVVYGNTISQRCITLLPSCVYQFHLPRYITLLPSCVYQSYLTAMHHLVTAQLCVPIPSPRDTPPYCPVVCINPISQRCIT